MTLLSFIWDPTYTGIPIPGIDFSIRFYSLMYIAGFSFAFYMMKKIFEREKVSVELLDPLLMYSLFSMIIGMRLGEVFGYSWDYYKDHLIEAIIPFRQTNNGWEFTGFSGLASHGATIGFLVGFLLFKLRYLKDKSFFWLVDRVCIPIVLGGAFVRIGNFINSEIVGKEVSENFIFATKFVQMAGNYGENTVFRHPSQLYEATGYLLLFLLVAYLYFKTNFKKREGFIFGVIFVVLFSIRFLVEFTKEPQVDYEKAQLLNNGQLYSIPMILFGFACMIYAIVKPIKK